MSANLKRVYFFERKTVSQDGDPRVTTLVALGAAGAFPNLPSGGKNYLV
jgi:hypothetical protein